MAETLEFNVLQVQSVIQNYEQIAKELNEELFEVKADHTKLKIQLNLLIEENQNLSESLKICRKTHKPQSQTKNDEIIIQNLEKQIKVTLEEKECVTELWQNCIKTIEQLETELKIYQAGNEEFIPKREVQKLKSAYEEKIHNLENNLSSTKKKLEDTIKKASSELEVKHSAIDQSLEAQVGAFKIVKNLESEVLKLQSRLKETNEENMLLEKTIQSKDDLIQGFKKRNSECMLKVTEAVNVVEAALNEKDAALFREKEILDENLKLQEKIETTIKACEEKIKLESSTIKNEYSEKIKELQDELNKAHNELKNKSTECENLFTKIENLEKELHRIQSGDLNISKLLVLEKNLESTFQKLLLSEKQNIQLTSERDSMKNDMEQITGLYERNIKAKEIEIATLNHKIKQLQTEIDDNRIQLNAADDKMVKLNEKILLTKNELRAEKDLFERTTHEKYSAKIEELTQKYNENIKELQAQIENKDENNKKWRTETKAIITSLEKVVSTLKTEIHKLKKENGKLKEKLIKADEKVNQYKLFLELISNDVNKISDLTIGEHNSVR